MRIHIKNKAFTLLEIMVVMAVISIIAAIVIPGYIKARELAVKNSCLANLREIDKAKIAWALETAASPDAEPSSADLASYMTGGFPQGPSADCVYTIGTNRVPARCSLHGSL